MSNAVAVIGNRISFFKSIDDYRKNIVYETIPYGLFMQEPYHSFIKQLAAEKRVLSKLTSLKFISKQPIQFNVEPWEVQEEFLEKVSYERLCGMTQAPTGSGKTNMFSFLIGKLNLITFIVEPTTDLAAQTFERLTSIMQLPKESIGIYTSKSKSLYPISIVTWQTLQNQTTYQKFLDYGFNILIIDEAHRASAEELGKIIDEYPARYKFGFSASPFHTKLANTEKMNALLGDVFFKIDIERLYKEKHLVRPHICVINTGHDICIKDAFVRKYLSQLTETSKFRWRMLYAVSGSSTISKELQQISDIDLCNAYFEVDPYANTYASAIDKKQYPTSARIDKSVQDKAIGVLKASIDSAQQRDIIILNTILNTETIRGKSLLLFNTIEKCNQFAKTLSLYGIHSLVITGESSAKSKKEKIRLFNEASNDAFAIGTTSLLGEGLDIPSLRSVYVASPIHPPFYDKARGIQVPGRAIRSFPGKLNANLFYFEDTSTHEWIQLKIDEARDLIFREFHPIVTTVDNLLYENEHVTEKINHLAYPSPTIKY